MFRYLSFLIFLFPISCFDAHGMVPQKEETRTKIAVVDTGVDIMRKDLRPFLCVNGHKSFVGSKWSEDSSSMKHGTNIVSLISRYIDPNKQCILILKFWEPTGGIALQTSQAVDYAVTQKVTFVNLSFSGDNPIQQEKDSIQKALEAGLRFSVAAGNDHRNLDEKCSQFPACYGQTFDPGKYHVVGSSTSGGIFHNYSSYGEVVKYVEDGTDAGDPPLSGTSQAAAIHTGRWASGRRVEIRHIRPELYGRSRY